MNNHFENVTIFRCALQSEHQTPFIRNVLNLSPGYFQFLMIHKCAFNRFYLDVVVIFFFVYSFHIENVWTLFLAWFLHVCFFLGCSEMHTRVWDNVCNIFLGVKKKRMEKFENDYKKWIKFQKNNQENRISF